MAVTDENMDSSEEVLKAQAEGLGVIRIYIKRVNRKPLGKPRLLPTSFYKPLTSNNVPKELIKNEHIMHLRLLGCIPGTLTPEPSIIRDGEVSVIPAGSVQTPAADLSGSIAAKAEPSNVADSNRSRMRNISWTDAHNSLAEENQQLKQRLKDVEAKQAEMLQAFMGGFSNAIQSSFSTTMSSLAAPTARPATPIKREPIKEEDGAEGSGQTTRSGGRAAKRTRTVIELD
ncbi:MAG: hypothetical protein Q9173_006979 [Seirophora scorigena]